MLYEHTQAQSSKSPQTTSIQSLIGKNTTLSPAMLAPSLRKALESLPDMGPELHAVLAAWPHLPQPIRAGIVAMVNEF